MVDTQAEEFRPVRFHHVLKGGDDVARPDVAAPQARRRAVIAWNTVDLFVAALPEKSINKRGLDLARQVVARSRKWVVHAFQHDEGGAVLECLHYLLGWKRAEGAHIQAARRNALFFTEIVDRDLG